jgi:hypothetical protein
MCDFCNDFGRWRKYFLDEEQRAYDRGWKDGWEAGRRADYTQREEEWAELYVKNPWWIDKLQRPSYTEMEERRYGPLPEGWADPEDEEHPGEARRLARVKEAERRGKD